MTGADESEIAVSIARDTSTRLARWLQVALLAMLIAFLYSDVFFRLVRQWWQDPNFSHGFVVPVFSGFIIWQRRGQLIALRSKPSWAGLGIIALALAVLAVGVTGADLFLSRSSFILLLAGLIVYFLGWAHFRALIFPWAFLFLMVPTPTIVLNQITLPLQFLASDLASWLLALLGVPVLRDGNVIHLPNMSLEVVEACSGIRSLVSLVTLALMYGYLLDPRIFVRVLLVLGAAPIAVAANGLRVMGTGLAGIYWSPEKAEGFFHSFSGWVIFVLSLLLLFSFHRALGLFGSRVGAPREPPQKDDVQSQNVP